MMCRQFAGSLLAAMDPPDELYVRHNIMRGMTGTGVHNKEYLVVIDP